MNMLDIHAAAIDSINEGLHSLRLKYRNDEKIVYGLVEGKEDPTFYRSMIERFLPKDWKLELIAAGNKEKVIDAHKNIDWKKYPENRVVFFVDRDLSEITGHLKVDKKNIYVTDGYSIENDVVTEHVLEIMLKEALNMGKLTNQETDIIVSHFMENLCNFKILMTPIMAQILGWRRDSVKANLNNLSLKNIFTFTNGKISQTDEYKDENHAISYFSSCVNAPKYDPSEIENLKKLFIDHNPNRNYTRGKYLVWFMIKSLLDIRANIHMHTRSYQTAPKVKIDISEGNFMLVAGPRARIPNSLKSFVENTFLSYINNIVKEI